MLRQPRAVWAVAFASVVAFMGIGLVDPILKPIADNLDATPSQVSLLFTSYMAVMGVAMLITGVVSSRIGPKRTLLLGLVIIIAGAGLAGMSDTVLEIVGWRALWGLGNALFVANTWQLTVVMVVAGSATAPMLITSLSLAQRLVPAALVTEGMAVAVTGILIGISAGSAVGGWAVEALGPQRAYAVPVAAGLVAVAIIVARRRHLEAAEAARLSSPVP